MADTKAMNVEEAMQALATMAAKAALDGFDIVGYDSFSEGVEVFEGKVNNTEISRSAALGIRVLKQQKPGIAFTERLTGDALRTCLNDALSHTALTDPVHFQEPEPMPMSRLDFNRFAPGFEAVSFRDLTQFAIETEAAVRAADNRIENVPYTGAARSSSSGYYLNSQKVYYSVTQQDFSAYSAAVAARGEQKKMGMYSNSRTSFSDLQQLPIAQKAAERSLEQLGAVPVPSGNYRVLFTNRVSGQVFSLYQSPYFAEVAQRGQSRLKGKLGGQIASPVLSLRSVALDRALRGSRALDSEGIPTTDVQVVEGGKFCSFLYNLESAAVDKTHSTGNGVRSIGSKAGTSFKNLVVAPGSQSAHELMQSGRLLVIDKLEGAAGCSAVSGEFSIGAQGFLFENGNLLHPVDRITLSSNYFDMLQHIEAFSNEYNDQYSSVRVPDMLINQIAVAG